MKRALLLLALCACESTITGTTCKTDGDCNLFNAKGTCEATGFCSYPDASCTDGRRYGPGAGSNLANTCLGGDVPCGAAGQTCCGVSSCGPNLTCDGEAHTCQCGAASQACCDGTTCGTGLACLAGTCAPPNITQVAIGNGHICALTTDRDVYCWGYDGTWDADVPGQRNAIVASDRPTKIANLTNVVEIRAAEQHTCARETDGSLWCWGHNEHGQLGNGTTKSSLAAVQVTGLSAVTQFDGGTFHGCALGTYLGAPSVWCWGRGGQKTYKATPNANLGRLGNNGIVDSATPVSVDLSAASAGGKTVRTLSTGMFHSCVVMSDNSVWCWGRNASGELGNNATTDTKVPVQVSFAGITIPSGVTVDEVRCSDGRRPGSTCMRLSNGTAYCWGSNANGQLGDGTTTTHGSPTTPVVTSALGNAKLVGLAIGMGAACGRASDGTVWCWGANTKGMVGAGINDGGNYTTPVAVRGLSGAAQLDVSHHTACAVDGMNRLWCWGNNQRGQISLRRPLNQSETSVLQPVQILP